MCVLVVMVVYIIIRLLAFRLEYGCLDHCCNAYKCTGEVYMSQMREKLKLENRLTG